VLEATCPSWKREYPGLAEVIDHLGKHIDELGLVEIWTCIDYWAKLGPIVPLEPHWNPRATWDLKRALLLLYGSRCDKAASELTATDAYTLGHLFTHRIHSGDCVISFNYDTVLERLARKFGRILLSPHQKLEGRSVTFAKPHGSVSWRMEWGFDESSGSSRADRWQLYRWRNMKLGQTSSRWCLGQYLSRASWFAKFR
jgi:hypothetical protein